LPTGADQFSGVPLVAGRSKFCIKNSKKKVPKLVTLYQIWGSHGGQYEGYDPVGCDALQFGR